MTTRTIPHSMTAPAVVQIDARLAATGSEHGVAIPFAIESGSRAWGFPSPDSDYDCRFVFVQPLDDYLSPWQRRDVIEWLMSPVIYRAEAQFRMEFLALAWRIADRHPVARHYLHLGERFRDECLTAGSPVSRKKILYALRPAAALRWLRFHTGAVAPMHLPTLLAECDPPPGVAGAAAELIARKAKAEESGTETLPEP